MRQARAKTSSALAALALSVGLLAGCGGAHGAAALPQTPASNSSVYNGPVASATFHITIPGPVTADAGKRKPAYVSSATKSLDFVLNSSSSLNAGQVTSYNARLSAVNVGTLPNANCPASGPNFLCTFSVKFPPGSDSITVSAFDGTGGSGNILSQQTQTFVLAAATANSFSITLDANVATMLVSGSGNCDVGPVGAEFGSVGTTPVTFSVAYTDPDGKTVVGPGLPLLEVEDQTSTFQSSTGTIAGTGGSVAFSINQDLQTVTLTPSTSTTTGAVVNIKAVQPNSNGASDGLTFTKTQSFTFSTGVAPPVHTFLAAVEQTGSSSGQINFYSMTLGGSGAADTFSAFSPATLAVTNSSNQTKPDVDNPQAIAWDSSGDLLIANGGTTVGGDDGNFACVPAGAISTGDDTATTVTTDVDDAISIALGTDGSVAVANNPVSAPVQLDEFLLNGDYTAAPLSRDVTHSGQGSFSAIALPSLTAGTYAAALTTGTPIHNGGSSEIAVDGPSGLSYNITDPTIDDPMGLAWDAQNAQLVIANNSSFNLDLDFYTVGASSAAQVKVINTGLNNYIVAASPDGHIAVGGATDLGTSQVLIFDNTSARTQLGLIPFNGTTTSCGSTYIFDSAVVANLTWLSNTKLLIALKIGPLTPSERGLYIFDISATQSFAGFDDDTCAAFPNGPKQTGFQQFTNTPLGAAYKP